MNYFKLMGAGISVSFFLMTSSVSASQDSDSYMNAQLAISDVSGFSDGLAVVATYGMPMSKLLSNAGQNFKFEGELTATVSKPSYDALGFEASYYTLAGYGVYVSDYANDFAFRARLGLLYESVDIDTYYGSGSDSDMGLSYGIGVLYNIATNIDVIAEYTAIEADISHISAGVQYKF